MCGSEAVTTAFAEQLFGCKKEKKWALTALKKKEKKRKLPKLVMMNEHSSNLGTL